MQCRKGRRWSGVYLEGRLYRRQARRIEKHLRRCARCEEEFRAIQSVIALLGDLRQRDLPEARWIQMEMAIQRGIYRSERSSTQIRLCLLKQRLGDAVRDVYVMFADHGRMTVSAAVVLLLLSMIGGLYLDERKDGSEDSREAPLYSLYSAEVSREAPSLYSSGTIRYLR